MTLPFWDFDLLLHGCQADDRSKIKLPLSLRRRRATNDGCPLLPLSLPGVRDDPSHVASWVPSKLLVLKRARIVGREKRPSALPRPSSLPFEGPSLVVSLSTCNNCGAGEDILPHPDRGHGPATHAEHGVSSIASHAAAHPSLPRRLPPGAVNSLGFQTRMDSKMAALRDYVIMNAPRSFPPPSSLPFRHTSRFVLPKLR